MSDQNEITLEQLEEHNTLDSLWVAVHGHVYNLTTFVSDHPGGVDALETVAGTDGTESFEYAGHNDENVKEMQKYRVARLAGSPDEDVSPVSHTPLALESKPIKNAASILKQLGLPHWRKSAAAFSSLVFLAVALSYQRNGASSGHISSALNVSHLSPGLNMSPIGAGDISGTSAGGSFWLGVTIASSISLAVFHVLYKQFMSTLKYQNDVFSFPPTIPKKIRR